MIKYVEYIQTDGGQIAWDTGVKLTDLNDVIYFDFMPLTGTVHYDGWYVFINGGGYQINTLFGGYGVTGSYGYIFGNYDKHVAGLIPYTANTIYEVVSTKTGVTVNGNVYSYNATSIGSPTDNITFNGTTGSNPSRCPLGKYYGFKLMNGETVKADLKPCLDENNNPCFYDEVSQTYIYHIGSGTPISGPALHTLETNPTSLKFQSSGGTSSFTVNCQTGWTCTTPTNFTLSTTSGASGETIVSVTAPNYTGATAITETITITDDDGFTTDVVLKQKKYSPYGLYNCFLGNTEATFYLGGLEVSNMYLGNIEVYSSVPYIGLKLSPSTIQFSQDSGLTSSMKVKSSEAWTLALPNDATWLSVSTLSGVSGETTVTLSTTEENTGDTRTAVITATTASFSATCTVNQNVTHYVSWIFTTNPANNTDYRDGIEIGNFWGLNTEFRVKGTMQGYSTGKGVLTNYQGSADVPTRWFWVGGNMYYDFGGGRIQKSFQPTSGVDFDYTISNWAVYNNLTSEYFMSGTPKSSIEEGVVWLNMRTCKISSIEVKQGNTVVFDGKAAIVDATGHIGLYDSVSKTLFYNPNLSMTYGE